MVPECSAIDEEGGPDPNGQARGSCKAWGALPDNPERQPDRKQPCNERQDEEARESQEPIQRRRQRRKIGQVEQVVLSIPLRVEPVRRWEEAPFRVQRLRGISHSQLLVAFPGKALYLHQTDRRIQRP